jgi:hypothetical protein
MRPKRLMNDSSKILKKMISEIKDPKMREVELRLFELNETIEVGLDAFALSRKIFAMYEIYKDVYGEEIGNFSDIMKKVSVNN